MNTQTRIHRLEAGQALQLEPGDRSVAVLSEGELLLQPPAQWLAGTVVLPAPTRLHAPALVPADPSCSIVALRASSVVVRQPAAAAAGALAWLAGLLRLAR